MTWGGMGAGSGLVRGCANRASRTRGVALLMGCGDWGRLGRGEGEAGELSVDVPRMPLGTGHLDVVGVAAGGGHSLVLDRAGGVYSFGLNSHFQLGYGDEGKAWSGEVAGVALPRPAAKVAAGGTLSAAIGTGGELYVWGGPGRQRAPDTFSVEGAVRSAESLARWVRDQSRRGWGQAEASREAAEAVSGGATGGDGGGDGRGEVRPVLEDVVDVACGAEHVVALTADGRVWTWGSHLRGVLGHGEPAQGAAGVNAPREVEALRGVRVKRVSAGDWHTAVVCEDGLVRTWGCGNGFRLGFGDEDDRWVPELVEGVHAVEDVSCGGLNTFAVGPRGRWVRGWGDNAHGALGMGGPPGRPLTVRSPTEAREALPETGGVVVGVGAVRKLSSGLLHSVAIDDEGTIWCWGWGGSAGTHPFQAKGSDAGGQLGMGDSFDLYVPDHIPPTSIAAAVPDFPGEYRATDVSCGPNHTCLVVQVPIAA